MTQIAGGNDPLENNGYYDRKGVWSEADVKEWDDTHDKREGTARDIVNTRDMPKYQQKKYNHKWEGSLNYKKIVNYLPHIKSAIQGPISAMGIDI